MPPLTYSVMQISPQLNCTDELGYFCLCLLFVACFILFRCFFLCFLVCTCWYVGYSKETAFSTPFKLERQNIVSIVRYHCAYINFLTNLYSVIQPSDRSRRRKSLIHVIVFDKLYSSSAISTNHRLFIFIQHGDPVL